MKVKPVYVWVIDQGAPGFLLAGDHVHDARRDARIVKALHQQRRPVGRILGRLEYDGVAGQDRGRRRPTGKRDREIEGRNHPPHAMRLEHARVAMVLGLGTLAFGKAAVLLHDVAVGADEVGGFLHVAERLQPVLAYLQAVDGGDVE